MKFKTLGLEMVGVALSFTIFSCSSSSKNVTSDSATAVSDSFPHSKVWNCVVKSRGKTFYGRAGNAIEAHAQAFEECGSKFKKSECDPILCELKEAN